MINLENYLYEKTKSIIMEWDEAGIYAISFLVYANEAFTYQQHKNVSEFAISYNTEKDCNCAPKFSEERWNYAFWRQETTHIINPNEDDNEGVKILFDWYKENKIENIGFEDSSKTYDENMLYIGMGPVGYYDLLTAVVNVAKKMQDEGFIADKFGNIPIIVHDLEYSWYVKDATSHANPNREADVFLEALKSNYDT